MRMTPESGATALLPTTYRGGYSGAPTSPASVPTTAGATPSGPGGYQGGYIPNVALYGEEQARAEAAYQRALAASQQRRNTLYHEYGLDTSGKVDPNAQFGRYQNLLGQQGGGLDDALESSAGRGLFGHGLAAQGESRLRRDQASQSFQFQHEVSDIANEYAQAMATAQAAKEQAEIQALRDAIQYGYQNEQYTPAGPASSAATGAMPTGMASNIDAALLGKMANVQLPWQNKQAVGIALSNLSKKLGGF